MLPRRHRLSRAAFSGVTGHRLISEHFSVTFSSRPGGCAVVVSKKTARRSVDRHVLRRRMLAVMRPWCSHERSLIVYARQGAPSLPFKALKEELASLLSRAMPVA